MDIVINFFKSIDGIPYYVMLVVNTILIFAIIGYLGEKSNEELMKLGMNTTLPNKDGGKEEIAKSVQASSNSIGLSIPKVSATAVPNPQANPVLSPNMNPMVGQNINSSVPNGGNISNSPLQSNVNPVMNNNVINSSPSVPLQNMNQISNPTTLPNNSYGQSNEKAPGVLIINSPVGNKDIK